jgi:hypothetical protein
VRKAPPHGRLVGRVIRNPGKRGSSQNDGLLRKRKARRDHAKDSSLLHDRYLCACPVLPLCGILDASYPVNLFVN